MTVAGSPNAQGEKLADSIIRPKTAERWIIWLKPRLMPTCSIMRYLRKLDLAYEIQCVFRSGPARLINLYPDDAGIVGYRDRKSDIAPIQELWIGEFSGEIDRLRAQYPGIEHDCSRDLLTLSIQPHNDEVLPGKLRITFGRRSALDALLGQYGDGIVGRRGG